MFKQISLITLIFIFFSAPMVSGAEKKLGTKISYNNTEHRILDETRDRILWQLPDKETVWLTKRPKRVIVLLTSLLNLWYETDGRAIARCSGDLHVPEPALKLPAMGTFNTPNAEKIIAMEPDLVISSNLPAFRALIPILKENNIEYAYFDYINFHDYTRILTLFSKLNNTENRVMSAQENMEQRIETIQQGIAHYKKPRVLVVFSTPNSVSCETKGSQTSVMLSFLGAKNIIPDCFYTNGKTRIQFSLERILTLDPDIILLNTMGDVKECRGRLKKAFSENQAWAGLRAIQEKRFYVLPKEYFLFKPNDEFPKALEYLANILYGDN